ncbi:hypothetical protein CLU79DRAFT_875016 [Phycomyces nitens]|nr:hypothetical protein CLU79DRAFT_875016 [Phycomyces nitens]
MYVYKAYKYSHPSCFREIKLSNAPDNLKVLDFYRLALFGKCAIEKHNLNGVLTFQTIGMNIRFYFLTLRGGFFNVLEVATIVIPTTKRDIASIVSYLDELLAIICLHKTVAKNHNSLVSPLPILPFDFIQKDRKILAAKRKPSLGAISSASKQR